jgi:hypothetical protein
MFKLRQTWPPYFSSLTLHDLDTRTQYIDPAWPITAKPSESVASTPLHLHSNQDRQWTFQPSSEEIGPNVNKSITNPSSCDEQQPLISIEHINEKIVERDQTSKAINHHERKDPRMAAILLDNGKSLEHTTMNLSSNTEQDV